MFNNLTNFILIFTILFITLIVLNKYSSKTNESFNNSYINFIHIPKNAGTSIENLKSNIFRYNYHSTDVFNPNLKNQLVILRNPLERFISSVNYAHQKWNHLNVIKELEKQNINTPDKWITVWKDPNHVHHKLLMSEILNKKQQIGNKVIKYKWTYTPQKAWFNKPKYIIILDNLDEELKKVFKLHNLKFNLKKKNVTVRNNENISDENKKWINNFYKEDWKLYNKYKDVPLNLRININ